MSCFVLFVFLFVFFGSRLTKDDDFFFLVGCYV